MVAFYPVSAAIVLASLRRPILVPSVLMGVGVVGAAIAAAKGRRLSEIAAVAKLGPIYAVGHGLGMWRGLAILARDTMRARR